MGKLKLDKDSLKGIFINHVEKMLLGVVLLVFVVFVYSSVGLEGIPPDQTPDKLLASAQSAEKSILSPDNAQGVIAPIKETVRIGYPARVNVPPTQPDVYLASKPLAPNYVPPGAKRVDPELFPPEKVEVTAIHGPVAYWMKNPEEDLLAKEKNSEHPPKPVARKKAPSSSGGYGDGESGMAGMAGMEGSGGMGMPAMPAMPGESDFGSGAMPGGMAGMPGAAPAGAIVANPADRVGFMAGQGAVAKSETCIAVKVLVPWKKQWEEFQDKLGSAQEYNPARDVPKYLSFTAERIEVSDDPAEPLDWTKAVKIAYTTKTKKEMLSAGYVGFAQEVADPRYLQVGVLTFPLPPFVNRDLEPIALHSQVPKLADAMMTAPAATEKKNEEGKDNSATEPSDDPGDLPGPGVAGAAAFPGSGGMAPGMAGAMPGMMPGMGGAMPGMMPGMGGSGEADGGMMGGGMMGSGMAGSGMMGAGMAGSGMMDGSGMGMGEAGMSGMMPGMPGGEAGMGSGGMGGYGFGESGMGPVASGPAVPYLLIRFFDFTVEPGKKYRYRVQTIMEDPNRPQFSQMEPSERSLDTEVKQRLVDVVAKEQTTKRREYFRRTEFSEPSDPIGIEIEPRVLAGAIELQKVGSPLDKTQPKLAMGEPQAKMMSLMWDEVRAVDVAAVMDVFRGTFLNFVGKGDAIHPVSLIFKRLEDYRFATDRLVADIRGGEELAGGDKDNPLTAPGEYALINGDGELVVRTEFDDWDKYRRLALPEPPADPVTSGSGYGSGIMGSGGGGDDGAMPGMLPGSGGGKRGRRGGGSSSGGSSS